MTSCGLESGLGDRTPADSVHERRVRNFWRTVEFNPACRHEPRGERSRKLFGRDQWTPADDNGARVATRGPQKGLRRAAVSRNHQEVRGSANSDPACGRLVQQVRGCTRNHRHQIVGRNSLISGGTPNFVEQITGTRQPGIGAKRDPGRRRTAAFQKSMDRRRATKQKHVRRWTPDEASALL
jgi:hypothetical protein